MIMAPALERDRGHTCGLCVRAGQTGMVRGHGPVLRRNLRGEGHRRGRLRSRVGGRRAGRGGFGGGLLLRARRFLSAPRAGILAGISNPVVVEILLLRVRDRRAVVELVRNGVAVLGDVETSGCDGLATVAVGHPDLHETVVHRIRVRMGR